MNAQSSIRGVSFAAILLFVACGSSESTGVLFPVDGGASEDSAEDIGEDVASVDAPGDTAGASCVEDRFGARTEQSPVPLPVDETLDDLALCDGGADWFAVDGLAGEGWTVDVLGDPDAFQAAWSDEDGEAAFARTDSGYRGQWRPAESQRRIFRVRSSVEERVAYAIETRVTGGAPDECADSPEEPNDTRADAYLLEGPLDALLCEGESDWFRVDMQPLDVLTLTIVFSHQRGDLELELYEGDAESFTEEAVSGNDDETLQAGPYTEPTTVYFRVYGFRDATNTYRVVPDLVSGEGATTGVVSGTVRYEDRAFGYEGFTGELPLLPARGVLVEVVDVDTGAAVGSGYTDAEGAYEVVYVAREGRSYRADVVSVGAYEGFRVEVRDRSRSAGLYRLEGEVFGAEGATGLDFLGAADAIGGALNVCDVTYTAFRFVDRYTAERSPTLRYSWQRGEAFSCGSCYSNSLISLGGQFEDPDEYDDDIILHEFGHYFVDHFSDDDSPGGSHRDRQVGPQLAYGEGLAYFWATMLADERAYVDNFLGEYRTIDLESVTYNGEEVAEMFGTADGTVNGLRREEISAAIMYDVYDDSVDTEPFDRIAIGPDGMMEIFLGWFGGDAPPLDLGPRGIDLTDWLAALVCTFPSTRADIQDIVDARGFPWDVDAETECP